MVNRLIINKSIDNIIFLLNDRSIKINSFSGSLVFDHPEFKEIYLSNTEEYGFYNNVVESAEKELSLNHWDARAFLLSVLDKRFDLNRGCLIYDDCNISRMEPRIIKFPDFDFNVNEKVRSLNYIKDIKKDIEIDSKKWYEITFEFIRNPDNFKKIPEIISYYRDYCIKDVYVEIERV